MKKNYDPRMHSAEHILNQTMDRMYQCGRCFNAHIERKKSKCDYHFKKALNAAEIEEIQSRVNRIIQSDLPVSEGFISKSEAVRRFNTSQPPKSENFGSPPAPLMMGFCEYGTNSLKNSRARF
jgi:Ser-tRNA(Ala) deacylase AlaX